MDFIERSDSLPLPAQRYYHLVFYGRIRTPWEMQVPLHFAAIMVKVPLHFAVNLAKVPLHFAEIGINELDYECRMRYLVFES